MMILKLIHQTSFLKVGISAQVKIIDEIFNNLKEKMMFEILDFRKFKVRITRVPNLLVKEKILKVRGLSIRLIYPKQR